MALIDQIQQDMVAAMKSRDEARLSALRMIKAALMKLKVDSPKPIDEAAEMQLLKQLIKQRIDAAEMYRKAGRAEQAEKEEAEKTLIESYLPAGASEQEIDAAIAEAFTETGAGGADLAIGLGSTTATARALEDAGYAPAYWFEFTLRDRKNRISPASNFHLTPVEADFAYT